MKKKKLVKLLRALGASKTREGANHEVWTSKAGKAMYVPRHPEVKELLARRLLREAQEE